jgi:hypothetical protein
MMESDSDPGRISFLGRRLPALFVLRLVSVPPGAEHAYDEEEWRDAIVVVEEGAVDLESVGGASQRFERGAVLWLTGLPLRALMNYGDVPAVLSAVSRRRP